MARSKRDDLKRKAAQAINHLAHAILDLNDLYNQFDEAAKQIEQRAAGSEPLQGEDEISDHRKYAEFLKSIMLGISEDRDQTIAFTLKAWGLGENEIIKFI